MCLVVNPTDENKEIDARSLSSSHSYPEDSRNVHKVGTVPKQNLLKEFTATFKEAFFADDPLRSFKDQPGSRKFILGIQAVFPIFEYEGVLLIWKIDKFDFISSMGAFFGVVFISVKIGLLIAVITTLTDLNDQPRTAILGKLPRTKVYKNIQQYPEATKVPGVLIVRVDFVVYIANSNYAKERHEQDRCIRGAVQDPEEARHTVDTGESRASGNGEAAFFGIGQLDMR
ncbi:High affinity sulfate transporter 1 [Linum perenne]